MRVLAVCAGNICRSPAAEAAIRAAAEKANFDIKVDSAGTGSWNVGDSPHPESISAGNRAGLEVRGRARKFIVDDFDRFDVIVVMDQANRRDVLAMAPSAQARAKVRLFRTFDPTTDEDEVPDPWGGPREGYEEMVEIVRSAAEGLVRTMSGYE